MRNARVLVNLEIMNILMGENTLRIPGKFIAQPFTERVFDDTKIGIPMGIDKPWKKTMSAGREEEENRVNNLGRIVAQCSDNCAVGWIEVKRKRRKKPKTNEDRESREVEMSGERNRSQNEKKLDDAKVKMFVKMDSQTVMLDMEPSHRGEWRRTIRSKQKYVSDDVYMTFEGKVPRGIRAGTMPAEKEFRSGGAQTIRKATQAQRFKSATRAK